VVKSGSSIEAGTRLARVERLVSKEVARSAG
jgi:hypothetical protein